MSLFEDLVDELKEQNLLEETIIDSSGDKKKQNKEDASNNEDTSASNGNLNKNEQNSANISEENKDSVNEQSDDQELPLIMESNDEIVVEAEAVEENNKEIVEPTLAGINPKPIINQETNDKSQESTSIDTNVDREFYRRRAIDEVNGLQMVEHVLSGVEREQMKTVSKSYEDIEVKQALHEFLKVADDAVSSDHAQAEFKLMQETEDWYSSLSRRDRNVSVGHLRRYCETTKPSLSTQALISLARFYRNSPYSESIRSKFDLVVTRLFTKEIEGNKRELVFKADELIQHIQELYAEWSSVPLYSTDEDDSDLLLAAIKFQEFINEAESAEGFDTLVNKDFFKRLKVFKEKTNENFFSPMLVAAAIESNVAVGNRYIELIEEERNNQNANKLGDKYGELHDKQISEATSKTLELVEILREKKPIKQDNKDNKNENASKESEKVESIGSKEKVESSFSKNGLLQTNKWLLGATILTIILGIVYFLFLAPSTPGSSDASDISKNVKVLNLENSTLKDYVQSAKINGSTLFAITTDTYANKSFKEKQAIVEKILRTGKEKEFSKVHLINKKGKSVAFGSADGINIVE